MMRPTVGRKLSCPMLSTFASIVFLILIASPSFLPFLPSFNDYINKSVLLDVEKPPCTHLTEHAHNNLLDLDFEGKAFPMENGLGPVVYRNAPWRPKIGRWLSSCGSNSSQVHLVEGIFRGRCKNDCSTMGVCNQELDKCRCTLGYRGDACQEKVQMECNLPVTPEEPYGPWVSSMCAANCDTMRALCFCGKGTKYPNRPVAVQCGFKPSTRNAMLIDWTADDLENILTTNKSKPGWCNVDPEEGYASKALYKEECRCRYDGATGKFCEIPTLATCLNQCSGHGFCRNGFCWCEYGWHGVDCSIPSAETSIQESPSWINPFRIDMPYDAQVGKRNGAAVRANVWKSRPLIYVYDLPSEFNAQILEGRQSKEFCVNRNYDENNRTVWSNFLHATQFALYEGFLASPHRTLNGEEADYFLVPLFDECAAIRADDAAYFSRRETNFLMEYYKKAYDHIVETYPYWNRSTGKDHIWFLDWDEGGCSAPKEIRDGIILSHGGNANEKHNYSITSAGIDTWNAIPPKTRGNPASCFDPEKDIVIPSWKVPDPMNLREAKWKRPLEERKNFFYYRGNLESKFFGGGQKDVVVEGLSSSTYLDDVSRSIFCGVLPGDGWSTVRVEDCVLHGCIPVIIQDGALMPFENVLDYESFSVRAKGEDIPNMISILRKIDEKKIRSMLANVQSIWPRFFYRHAIVLEAKRQKDLHFHDDEAPWAIEASKVGGDDIFSTLIQVLHYKLHNDRWRIEVDNKKMNFGVPQGCRRTH